MWYTPCGLSGTHILWSAKFTTINKTWTIGFWIHEWTWQSLVYFTLCQWSILLKSWLLLLIYWWYPPFSIPPKHKRWDSPTNLVHTHLRTNDFWLCLSQWLFLGVVRKADTTAHHSHLTIDLLINSFQSPFLVLAVFLTYQHTSTNE